MDRPGICNCPTGKYVLCNTDHKSTFTLCVNDNGTMEIMPGVLPGAIKLMIELVLNHYIFVHMATSRKGPCYHYRIEETKNTFALKQSFEQQLVRPHLPLDNAYVITKTLIKTKRVFVFPRNVPWDLDKIKLFGSNPVKK